MLKKKNHPAYVSKHNPNPEKQAILLMIPNGKWRQGCETKSKGRRRWHYLAL